MYVGVVDELADVAEDLERLLGAPLGRPTPLAGGITNRNYLVERGEERFVVRRPGKDTALLGIDRGAELEASRAAAELGIAPDVIGLAGECLVTRFVAGDSLAADEVAVHVEELGRDLRRFHDSGVRLAADFRVPELLGRYDRVVRERGATPPPQFERAREIAAEIAGALPVRAPAPCHNDLLSGNILYRPGGALMIVDWEYAGMGDARFDLGNLAVNNHLDAEAEATAAHRVRRGAARRASARRTGVDEGHVRCARGRLGRGPGARLGARLRLPRIRPRTPRSAPLGGV